MDEPQVIKLETVRNRLEVKDADLSGSSFVDVKLAGAAFTDVNLSAATIANANLSGLKIVGADLRGASLTDCRTGGMTIDGIALEALIAAYRAATPGRVERIVSIKVKKLDADARLPRYAHTGAFGDLAADLYASAAVTLAPGQTLPVATGIALEFPSTHGALVEDRSGLAVRGVTTLAGVIDPGYRGEIQVVMTNLSSAPVAIQPGDRIAQLRIVQRIQAGFELVDELEQAPRGAAGFGSTGQ